MPKPQVILVGVGFGGAGLLHELYDKHHLPDKKELPFDVTVVDRNSHWSIGASWQYVWTDRILDVPHWPVQSLKVLDRNVVQNIRVGQGDASTVEAISVKDKNLTFKDGTVLKYDTLVLSPGVISDASVIEGLAQSNAIDICNLHDVSVMKERVHQLCVAASTAPQTVMVCVTKMPYKCPPVPFEYASLLDDVFRQHGSRDNTRIILAVPVPFPFAGPPAAQLFCGLLKDMDIEYWPEHVLTRVDTSDGETKSLVHFTLPNGESKSIAVDGLFCTFPQRVPDFLAPLCNAGGYIPVDLQTNQYDKEDIFVIGDACHVMFPKPDKPHPKAGEFAWQMGQHVADQLMAKYSTSGGKKKKVPPPAREALCVAECGVSGKGVNVQPNFTEILRNPQNGMPVFDLEIVDGASQRKLDWINQYLKCLFHDTELQVPEDTVMKSLQLLYSGLVLMNI